MTVEFKGFPKMARLTRECIITEKIDGTNAQVNIVSALGPVEGAIAARYSGDGALGEYMLAGSRTRWITPEADNFGFAAWVKMHAEELWNLGPGQHFGEWWGGKIQRGYRLQEKRFSLFNTSRWHDKHTEVLQENNGSQYYAPSCCHVVPVLYQGVFGPKHGDYMIERLKAEGSLAAPGFMDPEGIVIYHVAAGVGFKKTIKDDEAPKSQVKL